MIDHNLYEKNSMYEHKIKLVEFCLVVPLTIDFRDRHFENHREEHAKLEWHRTKDYLESINH